MCGRRHRPFVFFAANGEGELLACVVKAADESMYRAVTIESSEKDIYLINTLRTLVFVRSQARLKKLPFLYKDKSSRLTHQWHITATVKRRCRILLDLEPARITVSHCLRLVIDPRLSCRTEGHLACLHGKTISSLRVMRGIRSSVTRL